MEIKRSQVVILVVVLLALALLGPRLGLFIGVPWDEFDESYWVQEGDTFILTTPRALHAPDFYAWEIRNTMSEVTLLESQGHSLYSQCKIETLYGTFYGQASYRSYLDITNYLHIQKDGIRCQAPVAYRVTNRFVAPVVTWYFSVPQICNTDADTNCDGNVDRNELGVVITKWINNQVTRNKLGEAIVAWL